MAGLPSTSLINELLQFCIQNGHRSVTFSDENPDSMVKITRAFFQQLQSRILVPNQFSKEG